MKTRSALMSATRDAVEGRKLTQTDAAKRLGVAPAAHERFCCTDASTSSASMR
jgi:predicted XRE-type DNA-binding protein